MGKSSLVGHINDIEIRHEKGDDGFLIWWFFAKKGKERFNFDLRGILSAMGRPTHSEEMFIARSNNTVIDYIAGVVAEFGVDRFWDWIVEDGGYRFHRGMNRAEFEGVNHSAQVVYG